MHNLRTLKGSIFPVKKLLFSISKNRLLIILISSTFGKNNDLRAIGEEGYDKRIIKPHKCILVFDNSEIFGHVIRVPAREHPFNCMHSTAIWIIYNRKYSFKIKKKFVYIYQLGQHHRCFLPVFVGRKTSSFLKYLIKV